MKKCPYCSEEIQEEALKCKFCSEWLTANGNKSRDNERIGQHTKKKGFIVLADPGGRLSRLDYIFYELICIPIGGFLVEAFNYTILNETDTNIFLMVFLFVAMLLFLYLILSGHIRRLHDFNRSGFWALLLIIPIFNFALLLAMIFAKGTDGDNAYGSENNRKGFLKRVFTRL